MPNNPTPDSPTEKSLAPSPGGPAGRLQRSPRRRHTKSQNGCPKEARTAQLVRVGEQASAGKGEGDSRKSRRQNRRQDYRPPSCTGRFPSTLKARGSDRGESRPHPPQPGTPPPQPSRTPTPARYLQFGPLHLPVRPLHLEPSPLVLDVVQDPRDSVLLRPGQLRACRGARTLGGWRTPTARRSISPWRRAHVPPRSLLLPWRGCHPRASTTASGELVHCVWGPGRGAGREADSWGKGRGGWPRAGRGAEAA